VLEGVGGAVGGAVGAVGGAVGLHHHHHVPHSHHHRPSTGDEDNDLEASALTPAAQRSRRMHQANMSLSTTATAALKMLHRKVQVDSTVEDAACKDCLPFATQRDARCRTLLSPRVPDRR
jgi:hypothetical protein